MGSASELDQALQWHRAGQIAVAEQAYRRVLEADPQNADAWCFLGVACREQGRLDESITATSHAIRLRPDSPVPFNNLGNALFMQLRLEESLTSFAEAIRLQPDYALAHRNRSVALLWKGCPVEALAASRAAVELAPEDVTAHVILGQILLLLGQFEEGWSEYAWRLKLDAAVWAGFTKPLWDGCSLEGRTILLVAEQGLGDTIHFFRYASMLKAKYSCRVLVSCQESLLPLLQSADAVDALVPRGQELPAHDVFAPLLQIPQLVGERLAAPPGRVPYLFPPADLAQKWKERLSGYDGFKIGIVWQGNPGRLYDEWRSFPLAALAPLSRLKNIRLFSLQKGHGAEQLDQWASPLEVVALGNRLDEETRAFVETAAVLKNLDLLITPDTAVAHLAGAMGVPVWLALSVAPDWRWQLQREDSPWYPTIRLFRQKTVNDWRDVFERMADQLPYLSPTIGVRPPSESRMAECGMNRLIRGRHGLLIYNRHDRYIGRSLERYGEYSEGECELFRKLLRPGQVVVEAGANIGAHSLVLSELIGDKGAVHAFEPQQAVYQLLCANMALNGRTNVRCRCEAVADAAGLISVPRLDDHAEYNFGGLALDPDAEGDPVRVLTIDSLRLSRCHLIKADVEGMELKVLRGAEDTIRRQQPFLYVENDRQEKSRELIEYILGLGYRLYWHLVPLFNPDNFFRNPENEFGSIVSVNMLGIPGSVRMTVEGLTPVSIT